MPYARLRGAGFNPSNGFVCLRTAPFVLAALYSLQFQSVERICVPSNPAAPTNSHGRLLFQSVERICVPSNLALEIADLDVDAGFQSVERICVPSNDGQRLRLLANPNVFQSVERICVPSNPEGRCAHQCGSSVSIRRTDLCAFEPLIAAPADHARAEFQSVERICVPSNSAPVLRC